VCAHATTALLTASLQLPSRREGGGGGAMIRRYYVVGQPGAHVDGVTTRFSKMSFDDAAAGGLTAAAAAQTKLPELPSPGGMIDQNTESIENSNTPQKQSR
jgi:hypothetical protein